jgi:antitoxin ParD1/3/4
MAKNTSIALGDHFQSFVDQKIKEGRFGSASEVVREGLRLLEERETKLDVLRKAIREGFDSGPSVAFDVEEFLLEMEHERPSG